jgi:hypothetical protein
VTTQCKTVAAWLRLDELLAELQVRLQAVLATRDRVNALFEAVVSVGTNLDIEAVLRGVVEAAVTLVDARYGAMGAIGEGGRLADLKLAPAAGGGTLDWRVPLEAVQLR